MKARSFFEFEMYTYFLVAKETELAQLKSVDDIYRHIEKIEPMVGGKFFTFEAISSLSKIFLPNGKETPAPTDFFLGSERFYVFEREFCEKIASTGLDDLLDASVIWSESEPWNSIEHNRMDLAGSIMDIASLCRQTDAGKSLYVLFSNED